MRQMTGLNELRERGLMTWIEQEHGWVAAPEEIVKAFSKDGFEECNRETTTSRRDWQPPGGDRKSTRLNSSHGYISYAVFCLKKKKQTTTQKYVNPSLRSPKQMITSAI